MTILLKRIYNQPEKDDGVRVLVDRIWPRGVSKEKACVNHWLKQVAPSKELRQWFGHDADKFEEFKQKYKEEIREDEEKQNGIETLKNIVQENEKVTLLFAAKDEKHNQAQVLKELLESQISD